MNPVHDRIVRCLEVLNNDQSGVMQIDRKFGEDILLAIRRES